MKGPVKALPANLMVMMHNNTNASQSPTEDDEAPDEPEPHPLTLLVSHKPWHTLGNVERAVRSAFYATGARITGISRAEVAVVLTSDADIQALNAQFRGKDAPTNVLSFPAVSTFCHAPGEEMPLGDIIIAYETVLRESSQEGKAALHHLTHLTVHGLLHLAGFDHETDAEAERMEALEREILASLDISDPYLASSRERPRVAGFAHE